MILLSMRTYLISTKMNIHMCKRFRLYPDVHPITKKNIDIEEFKELNDECNRIELDTFKNEQLFKIFIRYKDDDIFTYRPHEISIISYLLYLRKKYNVCSITHESNLYLMYYDIDLDIFFVDHDEVEECKDVLIGMLCIREDSKRKLHVNAIIINKNRNVIERFEPNGIAWYDNKILDLHIQKYADEHDMLYDNINTCIELQSKEDIYHDIKGNCSLWSFWYIEYRLRYPKLTREKVIRDLLLTYKHDSLLLHKMIVYVGKHVNNSKLQLYEYIIKYHKENTNVYKVLYQMHKNINVYNKGEYSRIISTFEHGISLDDISEYIVRL